MTLPSKANLVQARQITHVAGANGELCSATLKSNDGVEAQLPATSDAVLWLTMKLGPVAGWA